MIIISQIAATSAVTVSHNFSWERYGSSICCSLSISLDRLFAFLTEQRLTEACTLARSIRQIDQPDKVEDLKEILYEIWTNWNAPEALPVLPIPKGQVLFPLYHHLKDWETPLAFRAKYPLLLNSTIKVTTILTSWVKKPEQPCELLSVTFPPLQEHIQKVQYMHFITADKQPTKNYLPHWLSHTHF